MSDDKMPAQWSIYKHFKTELGPGIERRKQAEQTQRLQWRETQRRRLTAKVDHVDAEAIAAHVEAMTKLRDRFEDGKMGRELLREQDRAVEHLANIVEAGAFSNPRYRGWLEDVASRPNIESAINDAVGRGIAGPFDMNQRSGEGARPFMMRITATALRWIVEEVSKSTRVAQAGEKQAAKTIPCADNHWHRDGEVWRIRWNHQELPILKNSNGLRWIAEVLHAGEGGIEAERLTGHITTDAKPEKAIAIQELIQRAKDVADDVAEARSSGNIERLEERMRELEGIKQEMKKSRGKGGQSRGIERGAKSQAANAVREALKRAYAKIRDASSDGSSLAEHLAEAIDTGQTIAYRPKGEVVTWDVEI